MADSQSSSVGACSSTPSTRMEVDFHGCWNDGLVLLFIRHLSTQIKTAVSHSSEPCCKLPIGFKLKWLKWYCFDIFGSK